MRYVRRPMQPLTPPLADDSDPRPARRLRAAVLGACVLAHLALGLWLVRPPQPTVPQQALQVTFIPADPQRVQRPPPPPFPLAPQRPETRHGARTPPRPTASAPPDVRTEPQAPTPAPEATPRAPTTGQLLDAIEAAARAATGEAMPAPRDPTRRQAPRVPGRAEPYTPEAIVLRREMSPEDIVRMVGMLFGGNYHPCPDTQNKIRDLVARNERVGEDELRVLIDRERRRCR